MTAPFANERDENTKAMLELTLELAQAGDWLNAVKFVRSETGYGLRDSAQYVAAKLAPHIALPPHLKVFTR